MVGSRYCGRRRRTVAHVEAQWATGAEVDDPADDPAVLPLDAEEWLSWLATEKGRARATLVAYRRDARRWWAWLRRRGRTLDDVDEADIEAYIAELRAAGLAPATVARAVVAVRSLHRFLAEEGHAARDPGARVETPRVAIFLNIQPLGGALLGVWWLGERLTAFTVVGGLLILVGLHLTVKARRRG